MMSRNRTLLYARVSALTNADGGHARSVDDQLADLGKWAKRDGLQVITELRDDGISASRYAKGKLRPDWVKALEMISSGQVDIVSVWEISRASRDRATWSALLAACLEAGVTLCVGGRMHDLTDPDDAFLLDLTASMAVRESAVTSKRTKRAASSRAERGAPHGRVVDGYKIEYDETTGRPVRRVPDPDRAPVVREIVQRLLAGESAYGIAHDLNDRGITTSSGKQWHGGNLVRRMTSPSLAGLRVHRGEVVDGVVAEWEPLISLEDHHRLVAMLSDPRRKSNREGPGVKWLLTGTATCGVCDASVRMISGYRPDGTRRVRYACAGGFCVQRAAEPVDLVVERALVKFLSRPDVIKELTDTATDEDTKAAQAEVVRLRAQLADARRKVDEDKLSLDDLVYFREKWEPKLKAAEERARPRWVPDTVYRVAGPEAQARWDTTPMSGKRAVVKALLKVRIMPTSRGNQHTAFDPSKIEITRRGQNPKSANCLTTQVN